MIDRQKMVRARKAVAMALAVLKDSAHDLDISLEDI